MQRLSFAVIALAIAALAAGLVNGAPFAPHSVSAAGGMSADPPVTSFPSASAPPVTVTITTAIPATTISFTATAGCSVSPASQVAVPKTLVVLGQLKSDGSNLQAVVSELKALMLSGQGSKSVATFQVSANVDCTVTFRDRFGNHVTVTVDSNSDGGDEGGVIV